MNELIILEQIHLFVEALDGYFNSGESDVLLYGRNVDDSSVPCSSNTSFWTII
jgi:hypothetical protein